jgi:hypothetical protein
LILRKWSILFLITFMALNAVAEVTFVPLRHAPPGADGEYYTYRPDAARVADYAPISPADLNALAPAQLKSYTQEQLDQLYFRLPSGPAPVGDFKTTILVKNPLMQAIQAKLLESVTNQGLFKGLVRKALVKVLCQGREGLECVADYLWKGKRFYPPTADGTLEMRNTVPTRMSESLLLNSVGLGVLAAPLSQARVETFAGEKKMMLFPANVYCGLSLIDARRESLIIDYAYGDDFQPFFPQVDGIVGRNGLGLRDEIRMIRPGLYLGRAYSDKIFLLNFILESVSPQNPGGNRCWSGNSWQ